MIKYKWQGVGANGILIRSKIQKPNPKEYAKF